MISVKIVRCHFEMNFDEIDVSRADIYVRALSAVVV